MATLQIDFEDIKFSQHVIRNVAPEQSILEVLLDNGINLHHKCGMVCACSSCHIYIISGKEFVETINTRESEFLEQATGVNGYSRLACQSIILPEANVIEILIPDHNNIDYE